MKLTPGKCSNDEINAFEIQHLLIMEHSHLPLGRGIHVALNQDHWDIPDDLHKCIMGYAGFVFVSLFFDLRQFLHQCVDKIFL